MNKSRVAVFGANGQVGFELVRLLDRSNILEPVIVSRNEVDLAQPEQITRWFENQCNRSLFGWPTIQYVVNAAAYTAVDQAEDDIEAAFALNAQAVWFIARSCRDYGIPLIHISTDYVFDGSKTTPYLPDDAPNPQGIYAISKFLAERHLQMVPMHINLRTSWVYSSRRNNFVRTMMRIAQERKQKQLRVVNDQRGCPTPARDLAEAILTILYQCSDEGFNLQWAGTYHYCGLEAVTWYEFAQHIFDIVDLDMDLIPCTTAEYPVRARRPANSVLDCSRIEQVFGINQTSWVATLEETISDIEVGI